MVFYGESMQEIFSKLAKTLFLCYSLKLESYVLIGITHERTHPAGRLALLP